MTPEQARVDTVGVAVMATLNLMMKQRVVETYKNFKLQKAMPQWLVLEHGHRVVFGVRFHCKCTVI